MPGIRLPPAAVLLVSVLVHVRASRTGFRPGNCTLQCVQQGTPGCEYCRISEDDVQKTLGFSSAGLFAGCVPWPCSSFLGKQTPELCQHYVQAPENITIEFVDNPNQKYDTAVVSWSPSKFGITFLKGFQVTLQTLGGTRTFCQLFLLQNNQSLSATHSQTVYYSDEFSELSLGTPYAVTVMAIPVPELWNRFHNSKQFITRTCPEKNGLENCRSDWYPRYIEVHQENQDIVVTFNLAPENLDIKSYFSACFGGGLRRYITIQPDFKSVNRTHHTYRFHNLQIGTNYSCEIAADVVDAVRKTFFVQVKHPSEEPWTSLNKGLPLAVILCVSVLIAICLTAISITICQKKRRKEKAVKKVIRRDRTEEYHDKLLDEPHCVGLNSSTRPPRLLICYSSNDGPVHVKVVLQLATFLQKHMATQVHLDLWEALSIMEEGDLSWYCRMMKESDFVMVICSRGLNQKPQRQRNQGEDDPEEKPTFAAITAIIGEEICRAKALHQDLSKFMTAIFDYSKESDIPAVLNLASNYTLPKDLPLLFSHLHRVALQRPGAYLQVENISGDNYSRLPAGAALSMAIQEAKSLISV